MKQSFIKTSTIVILALAALTAFAQEKPKPSTVKPMPRQKNPVPVQNLMQFMGRWQAEAVLVIEGKIYKVNYNIAGRTIASGMGLLIDESFTDTALGSMKGTSLVGLNPNDSKIHWYSVDNMGNTHDHSGTWKTPENLVLEFIEMQGGKKYVEKIDFTFKSRNELLFTLLATLDGKEVKKANATFKRDIPAPMQIKPKPGITPKQEDTPEEKK